MSARRPSGCLALALVLALLCGACGEGGGQSRVETPPEGQYGVYYLTDDPTESDLALSQEFHSLPEGKPQVEALMALLLAGPNRIDLCSAFPGGTTLRSWELENGLLTLDVSEAYGGLSGVELTLADACVAYTLCQLEEVDRIYLTVEGRPRPFRDQIFTASDFVLSIES